MPRKGYKSVGIPEELWAKLNAKCRPHQALSGVLEELLARPLTSSCPVSPETLKVLERYRTKPEDTLDDLITNALNENQEFEKQIAQKTKTGE